MAEGRRRECGFCGAFRAGFGSTAWREDCHWLRCKPRVSAASPRASPILSSALIVDWTQ